MVIVSFFPLIYSESNIYMKVETGDQAIRNLGQKEVWQLPNLFLEVLKLWLCSP